MGKVPKNPVHADEAAAVWVDRKHLHAWAENPRKNDGEPVKRVMESIKRFGFAAPIVARTNGEVIAGHTRLKAAEALGLDRVPVRYMDLDPAEAHLLALADNKLNEEADWDAAAVASILSGYSLDDAALAGWDSDDLERLANEVVPIGMPKLEDGDRAPIQQMTFTLHDSQAETVSKAIALAKSMGAFDSENDNSNGNALARVCEMFLENHGNL